MRDPRLPLLSFVAAALVAGAALAACGNEAAPPAVVPTPPPVELVIGEPVAPPPPAAAPVKAASAEARPAAVRDPEPEPEPEALPKAWSAPIVPGLGFSDALRKGRAARDAFERLAPPNASEASLKAWFGRAQTLADQASRNYAGAFHAKDAPREGRIDAIAEAAELGMTMARKLDEQNLGSMPASWRSDPAVVGTFEDVEVGPTRRWRAEARVLTRQCIDTARETNVTTDAARRCAALRTGQPLKVARQAADAGAGCACSPGDPLCSASLGGWCPPAHP